MPPARDALSQVDAALAAAGVWDGPLTVDVLNEHLPPPRMVHQALDRDPALARAILMLEPVGVLVSADGAAIRLAIDPDGLDVDDLLDQAVNLLLAASAIRPPTPGDDATPS